LCLLYHHCAERSNLLKGSSKFSVDPSLLRPRNDVKD
jgi:hypothetical protein